MIVIVFKVVVCKVNIKDIFLSEFEGKIVFVCVDLNVFLDGDFNIIDDMCICVLVFIIEVFVKVGVKVVFVSYLGCLKKGFEVKFSLKFVVGNLVLF